MNYKLLFFIFLLGILFIGLLVLFGFLENRRVLDNGEEDIYPVKIIESEPYVPIQIIEPGKEKG